ncbi:MAG: hypothetical protein RLZZ502_1862 [Pseudomonadota bacterium]|jgi:DNA polymerase-3 subunit chi
MTEIKFYSNVADETAFLCKLVAQLHKDGKYLRIVTRDAAHTESLSQQLWTKQNTAFLPHCTLNHVHRLKAPIWCDHVLTQPDSATHADTLINCSLDIPPFFSRFLTVVDYVTEHGPQVAAGRLRYRYYKDRGYAIKHHDFRNK